MFTKDMSSEVKEAFSGLHHANIDSCYEKELFIRIEFLKTELTKYKELS